MSHCERRESRYKRARCGHWCADPDPFFLSKMLFYLVRFFIGFCCCRVRVYYRPGCFSLTESDLFLTESGFGVRKINRNNQIYFSCYRLKKICNNQQAIRILSTDWCEAYPTPLQINPSRGFKPIRDSCMKSVTVLYKNTVRKAKFGHYGCIRSSFYLKVLDYLFLFLLQFFFI